MVVLGLAALASAGGGCCALVQVMRSLGVVSVRRGSARGKGWLKRRRAGTSEECGSCATRVVRSPSGASRMMAGMSLCCAAKLTASEAPMP